jgi:hypothetical protein
MSIQPGVGYTFTASSQGTNLNIEKPWSPWLLYNEAGETCPFTIQNQSSGETYKFSAIPGMVNSIIPQIGYTPGLIYRLDQQPTPTTTFSFDGETGYSYIYLKVGCVLPDFPVTEPTDLYYPRIVSHSIEQASNDNNAFFLLATAYQDPDTKAITIWQLTCGSQWCDRIKFGTQTARYYFARA